MCSQMAKEVLTCPTRAPRRPSGAEGGLGQSEQPLSSGSVPAVFTLGFLHAEILSLPFPQSPGRGFSCPHTCQGDVPLWDQGTGLAQPL